MSDRLRKIEFGDFQTPLPLAEAVCRLVQRFGVCPHTVIEPACGEGSFLEAAARVFGTFADYYGFDINPNYVAHTKRRMAACHPGISALVRPHDFFTFDWEAFLKD